MSFDCGCEMLFVTGGGEGNKSVEHITICRGILHFHHQTYPPFQTPKIPELLP